MSKSLQERLNSLERKYRSLCCKANSETPSAPAYKVFTALLTQSGDRGDIETICSGELEIGVTYLINNNISGDFRNVGAPNNDNGTYFMATGTTPTAWGISALCDTLTYVPDAPVVTVLENTIGNIWWEYRGAGMYRAKSNNLFKENKTTVVLSPNGYVDSPSDIYTNDVSWRNDVTDIINVITYYNNNPQNDALNYGGAAMIEIKVYN
jgi:hypothetical protein